MNPVFTFALCTGSAAMLAVALWLMVRSWRLIQRAEDPLALEKSRVAGLKEAGLYWLNRATDNGAEVERLSRALSRAQPRDPVTGRLVKRAARKEG